MEFSCFNWTIAATWQHGSMICFTIIMKLKITRKLMTEQPSKTENKISTVLKSRILYFLSVLKYYLSISNKVYC